MTELKLKHRLCFPFCGDLGNKKIYEEIPKGLDDKINIKWSLFRVKQHPSFIGEGGGIGLPNSDIIVPGIYSVEKVKGDWTSAWGDPEYTTFMAPDDYYRDRRIFYDTKREFTIDLPKEIEEQPHLHKHSTFQFSYLMNNLFTCSYQFLNCNGGKIKVEIWVSASPSGTYLVWKSGTIFFKWKVEVRQDIVVMNLMKEQLLGMYKTSQKVGKGILKFASMGAIDLGDDHQGVIDKMAAEAGGKDHWKKMGMDKERAQRIQEQQTDRLFKSTSHAISETMLEPSIFYTNSIQFPYNLFDFGLRAVFKPHWQYRIYVSENLLNNLIHNNNINPVDYPLNITFTKLAKVLRKGYYQGDLKLAYDPEGFMTWKFKEGITFFEDMEKDFVDPNLGVKSLSDQIGLTGHAGEYYQSEEIKEPGSEPTIAEVNRRKGSDFHQRAHYFLFYEDGTTEHWGCKMPVAYNSVGGYASALVDGHTHGGFILEFSKPVKKFIDVYTCIGCGAAGQGYDATGMSNYDNETGDSLDNLLKWLPFEPWYSEFTSATLQDDKWTCPNGKCLGTRYDVWEQATIEKAGVPFTKAYGFIPNGGTIQWRLSCLGKTRTVFQKVPGQNDFDNMDWTPPLGSGGDIEIPLTDPEIPPMEPDAYTNPPEPEPSPDIFDPTGGEPEITIEPDIPDFEPELPEPDFPEPDIPDPDITPDVPEPDIPDGDPTDPDPGEPDIPNPDAFDPNDYE